MHITVQDTSHALGATPQRPMATHPHPMYYPNAFANQAVPGQMLRGMQHY